MLLKKASSKSKNWNIFVEDSEYKSDWALRFNTLFTFDRFQKDKLQRLRFHIPAFLISFFLLWCILYFFSGAFGIASFLIGILSLCSSYYFSRVDHSGLNARLSLILVDHLYQTAIYNLCIQHSLILNLICINIPSLISSNAHIINHLDLMFVYVWYYHFLLSVFHLAIRFLLNSNQTLKNSFLEILVIGFSTIIFGFVERLMKEDWVLYDSFKRSQNIYMKLVDGLSFPTFVTDAAGRILYMNSSGNSLIVESKKSASEKRKANLKGTSNFLELIHSSYLKSIEESLKRATKEAIPPIEIPLKSIQQITKHFYKCELGLDSTIIEQGYEYYLLTFHRFAWKATNCAIISCERIMERKISNQNLLYQGVQTRKNLKEMCGKKSN